MSMAMRGTLLLACVGLLAACGGDGFNGTFSGSYQGQPATFTLSEEDGTLSGTTQWGGAQATVEGTVEGDKATGKVRNAMLGVELPFEATLDNDKLDWVYTIQNPFSGATQKISLVLKRREDETSSSGGGDATHDPRLVGRWYREFTSGGMSGHSVTTRVHCVLNADGSFEWGGAQSMITLRPFPGGPGGVAPTERDGVTRGEWKSEGDVLYSRATGTEQWIPLGRYSISGNDMMLYTGGDKQLWSRE